MLEPPPSARAGPNLSLTRHLVSALSLRALGQVNEFWFGDPLTEWQASRLSGSDREELDSPTSHLLERLPFSSKQSGHSHIHYLKARPRSIASGARAAAARRGRCGWMLRLDPLPTFSSHRW
jgi:hypothetical protein